MSIHPLQTLMSFEHSRCLNVAISYYRMYLEKPFAPTTFEIHFEVP